tara:strand:- start:197 stop:463 length:267 start_codon:yes stop_codon:yes gene_type:complete
MKHVRKVDIRPDWYIFMIDNGIADKFATEYLRKSYEYETKAANIITSKFIQISKVKVLDKIPRKFTPVSKVKVLDNPSIIIKDDLKLK